MFIPYSVDVAFDRRPWASNLLFALALVVSFVLLMDAEDSGRLNSNILFGIFPFIVLGFLFFSLAFLWTFGRAVCSKIGNLAYVPIFLAMVAIPGLFYIISEGAAVSMLGCVVNGIAGMYFVFWPENVVECFLLIPPWRTFSISGVWIVLAWLVFDMLAVAIFEPISGYLIHLVNLAFGIVLAITLLKLKVVPTDRDDRTLLQIIMREESPDEAWAESWSDRKAKTAPEEDGDWDGIAGAIDKATHREAGTEHIRVLCQCGQVIEAPAGSEGKTKCCPKCSSEIILPGSTN